MKDKFISFFCSDCQKRVAEDEVSFIQGFPYCSYCAEKKMNELGQQTLPLKESPLK